MKLKRSSLQCTLNFCCCCCFQLFGFFVCLLLFFVVSVSVVVLGLLPFWVFVFSVGCCWFSVCFISVCVYMYVLFVVFQGGGGGIIKGGQKLEKDNDILEAWRTCRNAAGTDPPSQNQYFSLTLDNPKLYTSLPDITVGSHQ